MNPQIFLDNGVVYGALVSLPYIPFYLRRLSPLPETISGYLKVIVESIEKQGSQK